MIEPIITPIEYESPEPCKYLWVHIHMVSGDMSYECERPSMTRCNEFSAWCPMRGKEPGCSPKY
ncbi:MAG: hypothetical protein BWY93_01473 [Euryarchaeota archaeon ADurb.BinA087]|nr:MAG: hypothetical protein BWY93_01473 [Euryarchaeota archaeon ADurb.BinA087]